MSKKAIPVIKGDKRQTYEVQVENLGTKIMLKDKWKQGPPMSEEQITRCILHGNKEKTYQWCKHHQSWTIHSPKDCRNQHSENKVGKRNNGEPRVTYRSINRGKKSTMQTQFHPSPGIEQNVNKAMDEVHKTHHQIRLRTEDGDVPTQSENT
jgi:hypothetical protein